MIVFPNAKINLGLQIIQKRTDGYHDICSAFYPTAWSDVLEIIESSSFSFSISGIPVSGNLEENLCVRVYQTLKESYNLPPVSMHLHKNIPVGAGLGGGSADAAFCLKLLNDKFQLQLSESSQKEFIKGFGSDCVFFIENKAMLATDTGTQLQPIDLSLRGYYLVLVYPNLFISTKEAYAGVVPRIPAVDLRESLSKPIETWQENVMNDFEKHLFVKYPLLAQLKLQLKGMGAIYTAMSGSGSTMFGIFEKEVDDLTSKLPSEYKVWQERIER